MNDLYFILQMENGMIPLQQDILPGALKLPRRYEQFTKDKVSSASKRKSAIVIEGEETEDERMKDMKQAIKWIKQELVSAINSIKYLP